MALRDPDRNANARKGMVARQAAVKQLIANHQAEYNEILDDHRIRLGLPKAAEVRAKTVDYTTRLVEKLSPAERAELVRRVFGTNRP